MEIYDFWILNSILVFLAGFLIRPYFDKVYNWFKRLRSKGDKLVERIGG